MLRGGNRKPLQRILLFYSCAMVSIQAIYFSQSCSWRCLSFHDIDLFPEKQCAKRSSRMIPYSYCQQQWLQECVPPFPTMPFPFPNDCCGRINQIQS